MPSSMFWLITLDLEIDRLYPKPSNQGGANHATIMIAAITTAVIAMAKSSERFARAAGCDDDL
jgi:hypothetical protein